MKLSSIARGVLSVYDNFGGQATPIGMSVSVLAHAVFQLIEKQGGPKAPPVPPNLVNVFNDADNDGIDDDVDPDHGTVTAVTDEMIHAGAAALVASNPTRKEWFKDEVPFAAIYLAMCQARPKVPV